MPLVIYLDVAPPDPPAYVEEIRREHHDWPYAVVLEFPCSDKRCPEPMVFPPIRTGKDRNDYFSPKD